MCVLLCQIKDMERMLILLLLIFGAYAAGQPSKCEKLASMAAWKDQNTIVDTSLRTLAGTWISEGCETRPGPEYVLRSYTFDSNGVHHLIQHHYWDDSCTSPKFTVVSNGLIQLRTSIVQPDARKGILKPFNITVIPHNDKAARELDALVVSECPEQFRDNFRRSEARLVYINRNERHNIYNLWSPFAHQIDNKHTMNTPREQDHTPNYISCLGSLKWAFTELKLIKIQFRPSFDQYRRNSRQMEMELLLGDIHSDKRNRKLYSPTSFQVPLLRQTKGENFTVNQHEFLIKNSNMLPTNLVSNIMSPPHLIEKPHLPPYVWGEWISSRCESRPADVYLLRKFSFREEDFSWIGEHKFFGDPFCITHKFTVTAYGHLNLVGANEVMEGVTNIDFEIEEATLTPIDMSVFIDMGLGFCGRGEWLVNVPKKLSPTNGCSLLGIIIPSIRYDIVKIDIDYQGSWLLFLGQADTNNFKSSLNERPTAFQMPLIKCDETSTYSHNVRGIFDRSYYMNSAPNLKNYSLFILILYYLLR